MVFLTLRRYVHLYRTRKEKKLINSFFVDSFFLLRLASRFEQQSTPDDSVQQHPATNSGSWPFRQSIYQTPWRHRSSLFQFRIFSEIFTFEHKPLDVQLRTGSVDAMAKQNTIWSTKQSALGLILSLAQFVISRQTCEMLLWMLWSYQIAKRGQISTSSCKQCSLFHKLHRICLKTISTGRSLWGFL